MRGEPRCSALAGHGHRARSWLLQALNAVAHIDVRVHVDAEAHCAGNTANSCMQLQRRPVGADDPGTADVMHYVMELVDKRAATAAHSRQHAALAVAAHAAFILFSCCVVSGTASNGETDGRARQE